MTETTDPEAREGAYSAESDPPPRRFRQRLLGDVRARILASYVLLLALALIVSVALVRQILDARLDSRIAGELAQEVSEFEAVAGETRSGMPYRSIGEIADAYFARNVPGDSEVVIAIPERGGVTAQTPGGRPQEGVGAPFVDRIDAWRRLDAPEEGEFDSDQGVVRYVATPVRGRDGALGTFVVAGFIGPQQEEVSEAVGVLAVVAAGILLIGTALAFAISSRVLAPLRDLSAAARSASGSDLRHRIDARGSDEIAELARTFNRMMDRLESAFSSQREFTRDVSHELRTPIAVVSGHLELLGEGTATEDERRESMALVTGELDRMNRFVEDLLLLARSENPDFLRLQTVALDTLAEEIHAKAKATADRDWRLDSRSRASLVGDPQRLTQAAMSLISNAVRQTEPGDRIVIGSAAESGAARIWIADSGPGVPASERERIFERFARGAKGRQTYEGSGMGLAIVRAIAEAHGGSVSVGEAEEGGARFEIEIPLDHEEEVRRRGEGGRA
ncbi:HAMP domain-containing histidine kinase [Thermoleophilia bacterium SCSIO 60948]|nr:HAMP domain-containing histidine kinase [Thermoleophilia bacterium SCSIO 60948]